MPHDLRSRPAGRPPGPRDLLFVTGDRLAPTPPRPDIVGVGTLVAALRAGHYRSELPDLVPGQGMGVHERDWLRDEVVRAGHPAPARLLRPPPPPPVTRGESHKHRPENVLVAGLGQREPDLYEAELRIDDRNELLLDHSAGQHVAGMVAMEAGRQMILAVTERYFLASAEGDHRFALQGWESTFTRFLLPLPAAIRYRIEHSDLTDPEQLRFRGGVEIVQAGESAVSQLVTLTVFRAGRLAALERRQADATVARLRERALRAARPGSAAPEQRSALAAVAGEAE